MFFPQAVIILKLLHVIVAVTIIYKKQDILTQSWVKSDIKKMLGEFFSSTLITNPVVLNLF
jgi:hypothetical protein